MKYLAIVLIVVFTVESLASYLPENVLGQDANLKKQCQHSESMEYEYNDFFKITDLNDIQSTDFIAHIPIYVKAQRDALVLFTTGPKAMRSDNEYEIVIGGWGGNQTVIRRQQQSQSPLAVIQHSGIISSQNWTEFLIQITTKGDIKLFRKDGASLRLLLQANDPNPLPIKYVSFGSWGNNHVEFYFDCSFNKITSQAIHSLKQCHYADAMQNEYNEFYKIADLNSVSRTGFIAYFSFYVKAQRDAHVLFTTGPNANRSDNEYEIVIAGWDGTQTVIRRKQQSQQPLAIAQHHEVISSQKWTEYLIQITTYGAIKLFRREDDYSYKLIVEANDPDPLPVKYISFGSWENNLVEFKFNCSLSTNTNAINVGCGNGNSDCSCNPCSRTRFFFGFLI